MSEDQPKATLNSPLSTGIIYQFTEDTLDEALGTYGLGNTAAALANRAGASVKPELSFNIESLRSAEAPILDLMPLTKDMTKEQRLAYFNNDEAILSLFSNVDDFGMYDPSRSTAPGLAALAQSYAQNVLEGTFMGEGAALALTGAKKIADKMPARSVPQIMAKLGLYGVTGLFGAKVGQEVGEAVTEYAAGKPNPIVPSLNAYKNWGETTGLGMNPSSLTMSFRYTADPNFLGASRFIDNYQRVSKGGSPTAQRMMELAQSSSGLKPSVFKQALDARQGGKYFGGRLGFDPSKGPVGMRVMSAAEGAISSSKEKAFAAPFATPVLEALSAAGAGVGAFAAESVAPDSEGGRFAAEFIGAALPGPAAELTMRSGKTAIKKLRDLARRWYTNRAETLSDAPKKEGIGRLVDAIERSNQYTGEEQLNQFLDILLNAPEDVGSVSLAASTADSSLTPVLRMIDADLSRVSDELSVATEKGREQFLTKAKQTILDLRDKDGSPEAINFAAALEQGLFEESLTNNMNDRLEKFFLALERVSGGDPQELEKYNISGQVYDRLDNFLEQVKERETAFWSEVGPYEIQGFSEENLPTTMTVFDRDQQQGGLKFKSETDKAGFFASLPRGAVTDLTKIFNYFGRNLDGSLMESADGAAPTATAVISEAQRTLNKANNASAGFPYPDRPTVNISSETGFPTTQLVDRMVDQGASVDEIIRAAREEAGRQRSLSSKSGSNHDRLAKAFDAQATQLATDGLGGAGQATTVSAPDLNAAQARFDDAREGFFAADSGDRLRPDKRQQVEAYIRNLNKVSPEDMEEHISNRFSGFGRDSQGDPFDYNAAEEAYVRAAADLSLQRRAAQESVQTGFEQGQITGPSVDGEELENPLTATRLRDVRSKLLAQARVLRKVPDPSKGGASQARQLENLAHAMNEDLLSDKTASATYNQARAFTLAARAVTERTFLGTLADVDSKGRPRISREGMLDFLFKQGGNDAVSLRQQELDVTKDFIRAQMGLEPDIAEDTVGDIDGAYQTGLRYIISEIAEEKPDPREGRQGESILQINPTKLKNFKKNPANKEILAKYPNIAKDLIDAEKAQNLVNTFGKDAAVFKRSDDFKALDSVIGTGEKAGKVVANAISSDNPFKQLNYLESLIKNKKDLTVSPDGKITVNMKPRTTILSPEGVEYTQEQAKAGLRNSVFAYAVTKAGGDRYMNPKSMFTTLFSTLPNMTGRDVNLMEWMVSKDLMTKEHVSGVRQALKEMMNVEEAFKQGKLENVLFKNPTRAKRTSARMLGATLGVRAQQQMNDLLSKVGIGADGNAMGAGMVAGKEGSEMSQDLMLRAPEAAVNKAMVLLMQDPKMFRTLTMELQNDRQNAANNKLISNFLAQFGFQQLSRRDAVFLRPIVKPEEEYVPYEEPVEGGDEEQAVPASVNTSPVRDALDIRQLQELNPVITDILKRAQQSSLQPLPRRDLPPSTRTAAPRGVRKASVDPSGSGISRIDPERARAFFDSPGEITFAARGGEMRSGIGGLFR